MTKNLNSFFALLLAASLYSCSSDADESSPEKYQRESDADPNPIDIPTPSPESCRPPNNISLNGSCYASCNEHEGTQYCLTTDEMPSDVDPKEKAKLCKNGILNNGSCSTDFSISIDADTISLKIDDTKRLEIYTNSENQYHFFRTNEDGYLEYDFPTNYSKSSIPLLKTFRVQSGVDGFNFDKTLSYQKELPFSVHIKFLNSKVTITEKEYSLFEIKEQCKKLFGENYKIQRQGSFGRISCSKYDLKSFLIYVNFQCKDKNICLDESCNKSLCKFESTMTWFD